MQVNTVTCQDTSSLVIVERDKMHGLSSMKVEGEERNLGIVKNFKDNEVLQEFMPKDLAISWAHLDPHEKLDSHRHPVASLIVAIEGNGLSQGDTVLKFQGGDALFIPPWNEHGFTGDSPRGLWALSIQFNNIAIFESDIDPLTTFSTDQNQLPSLSERQINKIPREKMVAPSTFKNQTLLHEVLPENVDFCWHKIEGQYDLPAPDSNAKRLIIGASGTPAQIQAPTDSLFREGDAFWQHHPLVMHTSADEPFWALSIEITETTQ